MLKLQLRRRLRSRQLNNFATVGCSAESIAWPDAIGVRSLCAVGIGWHVHGVHGAQISGGNNNLGIAI